MTTSDAASPPENREPPGISDSSDSQRDATDTGGAPSGFNSFGPLHTRPSLKKILLPVLAIIVVAGIVVASLALMRSPAGLGGSEDGAVVKASLEEGATLPDFLLHRSDGTALHLSELKSKVTLINFWATWCEACLVEMPSIIRLREAYAAKGLEVAAIDLDEQYEPAGPRMAQKLGMKFPIYLDPEGQIASSFDISAIPVTLIIDRNRRVLLAQEGDKDWNGPEVRAQVDRWLSE